MYGPISQNLFLENIPTNSSNSVLFFNALKFHNLAFLRKVLKRLIVSDEDINKARFIFYINDDVRKYLNRIYLERQRDKRKRDKA